jgi:glycine/D-amino acid oxidase-like deaminating enzyme
MIGGGDIVHRSPHGTRKRLGAARTRLLAYLARVYPSLADERPEYAWEGLFAETPDGLPYIGTHRRYPRHLFALGYGGNGMTAAFLAAQLLLERFRQNPDPRERLFAFNR